MTNKELAVQLYSAYLQYLGNAFANPESHVVNKLTFDDMVDNVQSLANKLAWIEDK